MKEIKKRLRRVEQLLKVGEVMVKCPYCEGRRTVTVGIPTSGVTNARKSYFMMVCPRCFGKGKVKEAP